MIFRGHPSNVKVTCAENRRFESNLSNISLLGRSQLLNPLDLPCFVVEDKQVTEEADVLI